MANEQNSTHNYKSYFCPLCDKKLKVDGSFTETRCEACGMYVINTNQETARHKHYLNLKESQEKFKQEISRAMGLSEEKKYLEAKAVIISLLEKHPNAINLYALYINFTCFHYISLRGDNSYVPSLTEEEVLKLEEYSKRIKDFSDKNPEHEISKNLRDSIALKNQILVLSADRYAVNTANHNIAILNNKKYPVEENCVKIVDEKKVIKETKKSSYKEYLDPEPIPFPGACGIKWLSTTFWILGLLAVCSILLILGIWVDRGILANLNLDFSKYNFRDLLVPSVLGVIIVALWLSWFIYWILRKFIKVDDDEPMALKWTRRISVVALIIAIVYLVGKAISVVVCSLLGDLIETGMTLEAERQSLYNTIIAVYSLICLLAILKQISKQYFYNYMNDKSSTFGKLAKYVISCLEAVALVTFIMFGLSAIAHLINNEIVTLFFDTDAELVKQIVKIGLIVSPCVFVVCLAINLIWSAVNKRKIASYNAQVEQENKEFRAKNAGNIKVVYSSDIKNKQTAIKNLEKAVESVKADSKDFTELTLEAFVDYKYVTYAEIDKIMYKAMTGKEPPVVDKQTEAQPE